MTEQDLYSNLKAQDYTKWVETQSTEALEKELSTLELRRAVLQNTAPEMESSMEQQTGEDWTEEWAKNYNAEMAAATTLEEKKKIQEEYEGPRYDEITESRLAQEAAELLAQPASLEAGIDTAESEMPSWLAEQVEVTQRLEAVRRELIARRIQKMSKGKAASTLAGAEKLTKPSVADRLSKYRSKLKLAIAEQLLLKTRRPTYLEVCRGLDRDGKVKIPASWKKYPTDSSLFVPIYTDKSRKHLVENVIYKVWADLRQWGLLPPRTPRFPRTSHSPITLRSK